MEERLEVKNRMEMYDGEGGGEVVFNVKTDSTHMYTHMGP